jgi:uncharacterized protein (TIGR00255 family)
MTGFGRGTAEQQELRATVDIRAVNHRYLDLKLRGAALTPALEEAISARVRTAIDRGAVTVSVHVARAQASIVASRIDHEAAQRAYDMLAETASRLGIGGPDLALVIAQPGVIVGPEERGEETPPVGAALEAALAQLEQMRTNEGAALAVELLRRLDDLVRLHTQVAALAAQVPQLLVRRLTDRVHRLIEEAQSGGIEPSRLAQEVALLADRSDVTEELVRLASHLEQARALVTSTPGAVGRRIDFLVQEIGRELNTIGSKSPIAEISNAIVEAKAVLEKIREQVQNVE